jgi:hypothetical protein
VEGREDGLTRYLSNGIDSTPANKKKKKREKCGPTDPEIMLLNKIIYIC